MSLLADLTTAASLNGLTAVGSEVEHPRGTVYAFDLQDGNARVGSLRIDVRGDEAWFVDLSLDDEAQRRQGYFRQLCGSAPPILRAAGVKEMCLVPADDVSRDIFAGAGFRVRPDNGNVYTASLETDPCAVEEYARGTSDD